MLKMYFVNVKSLSFLSDGYIVIIGAELPNSRQMYFTSKFIDGQKFSFGYYLFYVDDDTKSPKRLSFYVPCEFINGELNEKTKTDLRSVHYNNTIKYDESLYGIQNE